MTYHRRVYLPRADDCAGEPIMRFRLSYEGELFATQSDPRGGQPVPRAAQKHEMRRAFHRQLKRYWETNIVLKNAVGGESSHDPGMAPFIIDGGGAEEFPLSELIARQHEMFGYRWCPLVRDDARLLCFLDVMMLRKDGRNSVFSNTGDIDNRIKTLVDCLRLPRSANELAGNAVPQPDEDPFFCLLRDDHLVSGFSVETDQLFDYPPDSPETYVKLTISVDIRPYSVGFDNLTYL